MTTVRLIDVPYSELHPTIRALSDAGADAALAGELRKLGRAARAVAALRAEFFGTSEQRQTSFAHVVDALIGGQIERMQRWNAKHTFGFTKADFANLSDPPAWPTGVLPMVVLAAYLPDHKGMGGVQRTVDTWWKIAAGEQESSWRWDQLLSDSEHLSLLEGVEHKPGLHWEALDLAAHWDRKDGIAPVSVRNPDTSPHASILAAAAHFPGWVRRMDGMNVPYVWIPGYRTTIPGDVAWCSVPRLYFNCRHQQVKLSVDVDDARRPYFAVPLRLGVA